MDTGIPVNADKEVRVDINKKEKRKEKKRKEKKKKRKRKEKEKKRKRTGKEKRATSGVLVTTIVGIPLSKS